MKQNLFQEAYDAIQESLSSLPKNIDFLFLKAQILEGQKKFEDALNLLNDLKPHEAELKKYNEIFEKVQQSRGNPTSRKIKIINILAEKTQDFFKIYQDWMVEFGSKFNKMEIKEFSTDYRGVMAKEDIKKEETIVFVPKKGMLTLTMAKQGPIGKKIVSSGISLIYPNNSTLSTYVLTEQANPTTIWKLMFKALPKSVSNFPVFFTEKEKQLLTGSHFLGRIFFLPVEQVNALRVDMEKDYNAICKVAPEFAQIAKLEDFMKARCLVNSRIFGTTIEGCEDDSIVPLAGI